MSRKILVAYATRYGSTQEVAEAVATIFREEGLEVESKPAQKVASLAEHRAMVLGAPLYFGAWPTGSSPDCLPVLCIRCPQPMGGTGPRSAPGPKSWP